MLYIKTHFLEIQYKLKYLIISFILINYICYIHIYEILELILQPLEINNDNENLTLYFSTFFESSKIYLYFNIWISILIIFPFIILNIIIFFIPNSKKKNKKNILLSFFYYYVYWYINNNIFFFKIFPEICEFLGDTQSYNENDDLNFINQIEFTDYFSLLFKNILIFNIIILLIFINLFYYNKIKWIFYKKYLYTLIIIISILFTLNIIYIIFFILVIEFLHLIQRIKKVYY